MTLNDLVWPFCVKFCFEPVYLELCLDGCESLATLKVVVNVVGEL